MVRFSLKIPGGIRITVAYIFFYKPKLALLLTKQFCPHSNNRATKKTFVRNDMCFYLRKEDIQYPKMPVGSDNRTQNSTFGVAFEYRTSILNFIKLTPA